MKQITFLLLVFIATTFFACSSDDDNKNSDALSGTTWLSLDEFDTFYGSREIKFYENGKCEVEVIEKTNGVIDYHTKAEGKYQYNQPTVKISWKDGYKEEGSINNNKMILTDQDDYTEEFTKQ